MTTTETQAKIEREGAVEKEILQQMRIAAIALHQAQRLAQEWQFTWANRYFQSKRQGDPKETVKTANKNYNLVMRFASRFDILKKKLGEVTALLEFTFNECEPENDFRKVGQ